MKKPMLKIALAVAVVLGAGSIATGSVILAGRSAPDQRLAAAPEKASATQQGSSKTPDREAGRGKRAVPTSSDPGMVATIVGLAPAPSAPVGSGGASRGEATGAGAARVVGASGAGAAPAGSGGASAASGRHAQQAASAMPLPGMQRSPSGASSPAAGSSAKPPAISGPGASPADKPATPATGTGSTPSEVAKVAPSGPGGNTPGNTPASTPGSTPESAPQNPGPSNPQAVPPVLDLDAPKGDPVITADAISPGSAPDNFGPNDLPTTPPSLNPDDSLSDPVIPVGAQDPVAGPKNTVAEPSSLALLGIAALGLVLRRRRRA